MAVVGGILAVADYLCSRAGLTALGVFNTRPPSGRAYASLGVDRVALGERQITIDCDVLQADGVHHPGGRLRDAGSGVAVPRLHVEALRDEAAEA